MKITELCITRPVFACVMNLILVVIGIVSYQHLELRYFPKMEQRIVRISTSYSGASADLVESAVTDKIEGALNGIEGVQNISSTSSDGRSSINLIFRQDSKFEDAVNQVRDKVTGVRDQLPPYPEVTSSSVTVGSTARATINLGFVANNKTTEQIRDYVDHNITPILREINGVGSLPVYGGSDYALRVWLDSEKMAALGVTVTDIIDTLEDNNIDFPAGTIHGVQRNFTIVSDTRLTSPKQFKNLIIRSTDNNVIRLGNIAKVKVGNASLQESPMLINGKAGIDVQVRSRTDVNPIDVATAVKKSLVSIRKNLPEGMKVVISYDQSEYLKAAINETIESLFEAVGLVVIVVLIFLGSLRASSIPIITIPLCIIDSFGIMAALGYTINIMTLLALVLAIGLVVDDAIVMLENIHRYIEKGLTPVKAAIAGSQEIMLPVIAMTITLAAVYAPIGFSQGLSSVIFKEFALTLSGTVIISGFVALTLSPMMCSKILTNTAKENKLQKKVEHVFDNISNAYQRFLHKVLKKTSIIIIGFILLIIAGVFVFKSLPQEFLPQEDIGYFNGNVTPPTGSSIQYVDGQMRKVDKLYAKDPSIEFYSTFILAGGPTSYVTLMPWDKRKLSTDQIIEELDKKANHIPGLEINFSIPDAINITSDNDGNDFTLQLMSTGTYESLEKLADKVVRELEKYPGLMHVRTNLTFNKLRYKLSVNREQAASLGVNLQDIATTMKTMIGGSHRTDLHLGGQAYRVIVQMQREDLTNFSGIQKLFVRSADEHNIPLSSLVSLKPYIGQSSLTHFMHLRSAHVTAQLNPDYSIGQAIHYTDGFLPSLLKSNQRFAYSGQSADFLNASSDMVSMFILAMIFIYLVLAAQFESFIDPFIILLTVPLSIVGALVFLKLCGGSLNIYTEIGLITLIGLVSKHGILITQFANNLREEGVELVDALVQAATTRLRPIIMTTLAMALGSIPLALATGPGGNSHKQIGIVIVAGLLLGTVFSLVVVPIAYYYLGRFKKVNV
jgi:multidrug efflux pump